MRSFKRNTSIPIPFHLRRLTQGVGVQQRTSGKCGDSAGESKITSAAVCEAGAAALGWSYTSLVTNSWSNFPSGCFYHSNGKMFFNTDNPDVPCTSVMVGSDGKCLCALTCQPGTYQDQTVISTCKSCPSGSYQDQTGQSSCESCPSDTYSIAGASSCTFDATSCPTGTYATGTAACDPCGTGQYSLAGSTGPSSCQYNASYCENGLDVTCDANTLKEMWPFVAPLEKKITTLESSVGVRGIAALETTSAAEVGKVSTLESKMSVVEGKVAILESTATAEEAKVVALETKTAALEANSTTEATKVTSLETTVASEKIKVSTLESTVTAEEAKVVALETKTAALEANLTTEAAKVTTGNNCCK
jgi:hypothetical protein